MALMPDSTSISATCWAVAEGLALVDNIQGAAFQTLHLMLALDTGEPSRIGRALAMEAAFSASSGATAKVAGRLNLRQNAAEHALPGGIGNGPAKPEKIVVMGGQPAVGGSGLLNLHLDHPNSEFRLASITTFR